MPKKAETIVNTNAILMEADGTEFSVEELPAIIDERIKALNRLDRRVKEAMRAANKAKEQAEEAEATTVGFISQKGAVEALQDACVDMAQAIVMGAKAQKVAFEFQTKLAEITKFLFNLGISNIVYNRMVVRELELRLSGASKEKISELARKELTTVVKQLKDQEDMCV